LQVEDVSVIIPFPKQTRTTAKFQVNMGTVQFDEAAKVARWTLGKMDVSRKASLNCSFTVATSKSDEDSLESPNLSLNWKIPLASVSGLSVSGLTVTGESYRPYRVCGYYKSDFSGSMQLENLQRSFIFKK
jgi:AP-3 complex subunit mu